MRGIISLLRENGPLTGKELLEKSRSDTLSVWRACNKPGKIFTETAGRRYLRLDRHVQGYARLSPSILREFLTKYFLINYFFILFTHFNPHLLFSS